ncbi:MAG: aldose 1-epimerase [Pseudomonadota bacterium]
MVSLDAHGWTLALNPYAGGTVERLAYGGSPILRSAQPGAEAPTESAAFPLFPFSGRIENGRFDWDGSAIALPPNFPPEPHAIHGECWTKPWIIASQDADAITLTREHSGEGWPWRYRSSQGVTLLPGAARVDLAVTNIDTRPMPAGLGWHPYFPRQGATLTANVSGIWKSNGKTLPIRSSALGPANNLNAPRRVDTLTLDHCFTASNGHARIDWTDGPTLDMRFESPLDYLIVFVPAGEDFFCVEPVSHAPNAVNVPADAGQRTLAPGETLSASIMLAVS